MLKTSVLTTIAVLTIQFLFVAPTSAQSSNNDARTAKIRSDLTKRGTSEKSKVTIKLRDGREVKGFIAELNADDFVVANSKTSQRQRIKYADALKAKKSGLSLGAKIGIGVGVLIAVGVVVVLAAKKPCDDGGCF